MNEHTVTTRVRYGETDQMGVVYHAHYLAYFEMARTELLRSAGLAYSEMERRGIFLVVTEASCRYRSPARYDEVLQVRARVAGRGKASVRFEYDIRAEDGRLVAEGHTELASVDGRKRPTRLPDAVADLLE